MFTVCGNAANEACPVWPGGPMTAHWGLADPAGFEGPRDEQHAIFSRTYEELHRCIERLTCLPIESLDRFALSERLEEIGKSMRPTGGGA